MMAKKAKKVRQTKLLSKRQEKLLEEGDAFYADNALDDPMWGDPDPCADRCSYMSTFKCKNITLLGKPEEDMVSVNLEPEDESFDGGSVFLTCDRFSGREFKIGCLYTVKILENRRY